MVTPRNVAQHTEVTKMMTLDKAIDRAIDRINLIGDGCDVYGILYQYKTIRELPEDEIDKIYDHVIKVLGF